LDFLDVRQVLYITNLNQDALIDRILGRAHQAELNGVQVRLEDLEPDKIRKRLGDYHEQTVPLLERYGYRMIQAIDGSLDINEVSAQIDQVILRK
jgi:adenylate kinase family enzyme